MSTTITASYTVIPNECTPNSPAFGLSDSDQMVRWSHAFIIYVYREIENPTHNAMERMRDSLSKMLVYYYPLAGRLSWIEGDRVGLNCNAKGATLIEAESTKSLAEYGDFAPNETIEKELVPTVDYTQPIEELPLLLVQLTKFQGAKQGLGLGLDLVIGVAISHVLVDGLATARFINSWAKLCRGDPLDPNEMFPFLDRTVLNASTRPCFDHPELRPHPFLLGSIDNVAEQKHKKTAAVLNLTAEQVEKLKRESQSQGSHTRSRPYSTYEVVAAHIWGCACKARGLDDLQPTVVRVTADIRNRLNPPLPQNYFGNALAAALTPTCCARDVVSNPVGYRAGKIREAIGLLSDKYIRSQWGFIRCQEQLDWVRASYLDREGGPRNAAFYGNPNLNIVSWMSMPVYEADFGWGRPVYFGPGAMNTDGKAYIIQSSSSGDASLVVFIHLQMRHVELFKKFFYEDIEGGNSPNLNSHL